MLKIKKQDLERIFAQAKAEYPAECCGILTVGADGGASQVHPCRNIQERLHAEDPERYPRTPRTAYFIDSQELYRIVSGAEKAGGAVSGFYHSHIDCEAYFSAEDKERAMVWGEPAYPDAVYPVVSVQKGEVVGYKCFAWDAGAGPDGDFVEVEIDVVD